MLAISYELRPRLCTVAGVSTSVSGLVTFLALNRFPNSACDQATASCVQYANLSSLELFVTSFSTVGRAPEVGVGTYTVGPKPSGSSGSYATADAHLTNSTCGNTLTGTASPSGTVVITYIATSDIGGVYTSVYGTYDVVVYGLRYIGTFHSSTCGAANFQGDICTGEVKGSCSGTVQCVQ